MNLSAMRRYHTNIIHEPFIIVDTPFPTVNP